MDRPPPPFRPDRKRSPLEDDHRYLEWVRRDDRRAGCLVAAAVLLASVAVAVALWLILR